MAMPPRPSARARARARPAARARGGRRATAAEKARANRILDLLEEAHPEADCALHWRNPFELLAATILSAQCTDARVNQVTPALFRRYPDAAALAGAQPAELERLIQPTGFFRAKAKSLIGCARGLQAAHGGVVPDRLAPLVELPGVGRKTASVVIGHAYNVAEGIAVDTHVLRVSNRLGIARAAEAAEVERQLMALLPRERWVRTTDLLIFHGRKICSARRPACGDCPVFPFCRWPQKRAFAMKAAAAPRASRGRR
jgi:endonuclease-3